MRVYISGPMSGYHSFNYPAFNAAAAAWRAAVKTVHNPAENFAGDTGLKYASYIREDLCMLLNSDAIAMLPGWERSKGAKYELMTAQLLGLEVFDAISMKPFDPQSMVCIGEVDLNELEMSADPHF